MSEERPDGWSNLDDEGRVRAVLRELREMQALRDNLSATQGRCGELLEENRALKRQLASMKLRWLQLLEMQEWEAGPEEGTTGMDFKVRHDHKEKQVIIERDVSPPSHRCVTDGHSYGHGDTCFYCGHTDET